MLDVNGYLGISHSGVRGPNSYWVLIKGVTSFLYNANIRVLGGKSLLQMVSGIRNYKLNNQIEIVTCSQVMML